MNSLIRNGILKRVSVLMSGTVIGQLALFSVTPILTRVYPTSSFNDFGIYTAILSVASVVATFRLESAIPIAKDRSEAYSIANLSILTSAIIAIASLLVSFIILKAGLINISSSIWHFSILIGISVFLVGAFESLIALQIRLDSFKKIAYAKATQGFASAIGQVSMSILSYSSVGMIMGDAFGRIFGFKNLYADFRRNRPVIRKSNLLLILKKYKDFPLYSTPAGLVNSLGVQAPIFLLSAAFTPSQVGLYIFCNRILAIPTGLLARNLGQVYLSEFSRMDELNQPTSSIAKQYFLISFISASLFCIPLIVFSDKIIPFIFGDQWAAAVPMLKALLILSIFQVSAVTISQTLNATRKNSWQLIWDSARLISLFATFYWSKSNDQTVYQSVECYSITNTVFYIILIIISINALKHKSRSQYL